MVEGMFEDAPRDGDLNIGIIESPKQPIVKTLESMAHDDVVDGFPFRNALAQNIEIQRYTFGHLSDLAASFIAVASQAFADEANGAALQRDQRFAFFNVERFEFQG